MIMLGLIKSTYILSFYIFMVFEHEHCKEDEQVPRNDIQILQEIKMHEGNRLLTWSYAFKDSWCRWRWRSFHFRQKDTADHRNPPSVALLLCEGGEILQIMVTGVGHFLLYAIIRRVSRLCLFVNPRACSNAPPQAHNYSMLMMTSHSFRGADIITRAWWKTAKRHRVTDYTNGQVKLPSPLPEACLYALIFWSFRSSYSENCSPPNKTLIGFNCKLSR